MTPTPPGHGFHRGHSLVVSESHPERDAAGGPPVALKVPCPPLPGRQMVTGNPSKMMFLVSDQKRRIHLVFIVVCCD